MDNANIYRLNHQQTVDLISLVGHKKTVLVLGHTGTGKTALLRMLAERHPTHLPIYFDCTTKEAGDLMLPRMKNVGDNDYVTFATNEELGLHLQDTPSIIMLDEFGKNKSIMNPLNRFILERQMGRYKLHPESILFATSNLTAEGLGDMLPAHTRNRIIVVELRKATADEWVIWAINNDIDPVVAGWVRENPHCMQDFREIKNPEDNPLIYHPRAVGRDGFVTGRSLETASMLVKLRDRMDSHTLTAALIGTLGTRAALDMQAFITLANKLPTQKSIKETPETAKVPDNPAALCMIVFRALASIERDWLDAWMIYLNRLPAEAQAMFANGVRAKGYAKAGMVATHKAFTDYARKNAHLFGADI
jgi:energy-coupling factor transporter ATP-binding protein EcfA2